MLQTDPVKMDSLEDSEIKQLERELIEKENTIQRFKLERLARERHAYARCEAEILRTVILSGWVVNKLEERKEREAGKLVKEINAAL